MRIALALVTAMLASPAAAQNTFEDIRLRNALGMQQDLARQQSLAAQREAFAASQRAGASARIQSLAIRPAPVTPAPLNAQMLADAEVIARIQDQALAASNARILAIKPASQP